VRGFGKFKMNAAPTLDELATDLSLLKDLEQEALVRILMRSSTLRDASMVEMVRRVGSGTAGKDDDRLLTVEEAAEILKETKDALYHKAKRWGITIKLGNGTLRFSRNAIQALIRERLEGNRKPRSRRSLDEVSG
jgi:hypothetical protein